jgi:protein-ribulosamine 3-kinase
MPDWSSIKHEIEKAGVSSANDAVASPVSGGDISAAWRLEVHDGALFVKTGPPSAAEMFAAEAEGLAEISHTGTIAVPQLIASGQIDTGVFLALEWLDLERADEEAERHLGEQLANLHRSTASGFGWHRDNTIGLMPQINTRNDDWVEFFRDHRLAFQLALAAQNGFSGELQELGARLLKRLPVYFEPEQPAASLLHGDLWGGNWACCNGRPVIFDPAVYYGDRETDLAMTRLFGGFGRNFYEAYEAAWPLRDGHLERQHLYQLYHVLNHLNLFGSAYLGGALELIKKLL